MNRNEIWTTVRRVAILDREEFLEAWEGTDNQEVISDTCTKIERFKKLKATDFKAAMDADSEGVRQALLSAEIWFRGLSDANVGKEKRHAQAMYKRVFKLRMNLFGKTQTEAVIENCVSVPIHRVTKLIESGMSPSEFLLKEIKQ